MTIQDGVIAVKDNKIVFVGKRSSAGNIHAEKKIDARGKVALPGLVNCHTHVAMTLFRGIAEDKPLNVWLRRHIWPLEAKLKKEDAYAGALLGCLEMLKNGITCFADMYFCEDMVAKAVSESGLRAVLAEGIIEAGNKTKGEQMLSKSIEFAKKFYGNTNGRIYVMLAPHAAYSCSPELLQKIRENASKLEIGVHIHLAESAEMFKELEANYGCSEVEFLDKIGFFEGHTLAAHCINLSDMDRRILAGRGVNVVYVPVSNMKLGLGIARIKELIELGVNVAMGTDSPASNNVLDMFETMKFGTLLQKLAYMNPEVLPAYETLKMATVNGAKALGLERSIGTLETGKKADVILVDFSKPNLKPLHDVYANIIYACHGGDVDTVVVDGKILMEQRQLNTLNERAVIEKAERHAANLLARKP